MRNELPQGWVTAPIEEIIEDFQSGFASGEKNVKGGVAHLRMNNIGLNGELVLDLVRTVPGEIAKPHYDLQLGDVLVCTTNSGKLVGKCSYFDLTERYTFSNHLTRLRPKPAVVDGRFLRWNLWLHWQRGEFDDKCKHWVNQSTIPKEVLLETDVALPPFSEQCRILAKLDQLISNVQSCQERLEKIPRLLRRFRQSVLAAACSGRLTEDWRGENSEPPIATTDGAWPFEIPKSWSWKTFKNVAREITVGYVGTMAKEYVESGIPFLRSLNVRPFRFDSENLKFIRKDFHEKIYKSRLHPGDVAIVRSGNSGISCVIPTTLPEANCSDLVILRPGPLLDSTYACFFLNSNVGKTHVNSVKVGIAQGHFNIGSMKVTPVPLPPLAEQQEIVRRVEVLFKLADQIEARYQKAKTNVDKLTQSILAKAFRGELVPQDPNDEPASVLLERIKSQRKAVTKPTRRRKSNDEKDESTKHRAASIG